jgi:hypothetical protein
MFLLVAPTSTNNPGHNHLRKVKETRFACPSDNLLRNSAGEVAASKRRKKSHTLKAGKIFSYTERF